MGFSRHGVALILSGPSGVGKSTLKNALVADAFDFQFSVSCTTRPPRSGEQDGLDYHFVTPERFEQHLAAGAFLEHAEVHGNLYGTLRSEVEDRVLQGQDVLLDIDVQGVRQIQASAKGLAWGSLLCFVFVGPPSLAELERRLRSRGTDPDEVIARRLRVASEEMAHWNAYDYLLVNDDVAEAIDGLQAIVHAEHRKADRVLDCPW